MKVAPEWEPLLSMAKSSGRLQKYATLKRDGTIMIHKDPIDLDGWIAPTPTARAIAVERDMSAKCPNGTILIYDAGKQENLVSVRNKHANTYIVVDDRKTRQAIYVCEVEGLNLVSIEDREPVVSLTGSDENPSFPNKLIVHPLIGRMCLAGSI
jgi:hypothetical protein